MSNAEPPIDARASPASPAPPKTYGDHKSLLARRLRGEPVELPARAVKAGRVDERLVQCVWFDRLVREDALITRSGKRVGIVDPGRWNHEAGPDFLGASLVIDGERVKGDVEIHVDARDWRRHGHHRDFEYNRVVVHAVLDAPDEAVVDLRHNGGPVERLILRHVIDPDIETIRRSLNVEDFPYEEQADIGRCAAIIREMSDEFLRVWLDLAGRERFEAKVERFREQAHGVSLDQVFYQGLMTAMGHKGGKALYFLLAKRVPLDELDDFVAEAPADERALRIESILLHVAGLIAPADSPDVDKMDDETRNYVGRLRKVWDPAEPYFCDRLIPPTRRWYAGVRPVNFPPRRLAGVARILAGAARPTVFFQEMMVAFRKTAPGKVDRPTAKVWARELARRFLVEEDGFWDRRYSFTARRSARRMTLIGASRADSVVLNAFLPMAVLDARESGDADFEAMALELFRRFPKLQENSVTRFMRRRLFVDDPRAGELLTTEARQQALFYLFNDCCNSVSTTCDQCDYLRAE